MEREQNYAHDPIVPERCMGMTPSAGAEMHLDPRLCFRVVAAATGRPSGGESALPRER